MCGRKGGCIRRDRFPESERQTQRIPLGPRWKVQRSVIEVSTRGRFFENDGNWTEFFQRDSAVSRLAGTLSRVITNVPTSCLDIPTRCNTPEGLVHTKHTSTPLRYSRRKEAALSSEIIIGVARRGETRRRAWSIRTDDESVARPQVYITWNDDSEHRRSVFSTLFENRIGARWAAKKGGWKGERLGEIGRRRGSLAGTFPPLPTAHPSFFLH